MVKYGLIKDHEFFEWQEGCMEGMVARDAGILAEAVERSCINKAQASTSYVVKNPLSPPPEADEHSPRF